MSILAPMIHTTPRSVWMRSLKATSEGHPPVAGDWSQESPNGKTTSMSVAGW
jgi:hypothetical protein